MGAPAKSSPATRAPGFDGLAWVHGELSAYRRQSHRATGTALVLALILVVSLGANVLQLMTKPAPRYFAATPDLRLAALTPLDRPVMSTQAMTNWAAKKVAATFAIDWENWRRQLTAVRPAYTGKAFDDIVSSLNQPNGVLDLVRNRRLAVAVELPGAPILRREGMLNGVRAWQVEFPLNLSFESTTGVEATQHLIATAIVTRIDQRTNPVGLALAQVVLNDDPRH